MTTTDLSKFGYRELALAGKLLTAYANGGAPDDFDQEGIQVMMNQNSGNVFLTNSEYQVCMMNGDTLESFYNSPYEGREGFYDELKNEYEDMHDEDKEWFRDIAEARNDDEFLESLEEEEEEEI